MPKLVKSPEELLEVLLKNRNINTDSKKASFFNPKLENYEADFELKGIDDARARILKAIDNKELIIIYGDYDADGLCSTAILYHGLTTLGGKVLPYIPHREKEGYGLSKLGLDDAKVKGATLVITVDNGIVAIEQSLYAKKIGLDLIITDHHLPSDKTPEALAIIHSTKMCGAGVAWCLIRSLLTKSESEPLLDLVAIGTICDMMPLLEVNRALVTEGLKVMKKTPRVGLISLINECGLTREKIGAYQISHIIGPRINSVGRVDSALDGLRLLCTKDPVKGNHLARLMCVVNDQKKELMVTALNKIREEFKLQSQSLSDKKIIVLQSEEWIPGIIGLLAGRIAEEYKLPSIVISEHDGVSKGSARSVDGLDMVSLIRKCSEVLIDVGGHPKAAGFTIETKNIAKFKKLIEAEMKDYQPKTDDLMKVEALLDLNSVNKSWVKTLNTLEPFGIGNPRPTFGAETKVSDVKTVGLGKHLKFKSSGVESIAFGMGELSQIVQTLGNINVTFYLEINEFNGSETLQLSVSDIKLN